MSVDALRYIQDIKLTVQRTFCGIDILFSKVTGITFGFSLAVVDTNLGTAD
jgi:hypothetical protein